MKLRNKALLAVLILSIGLMLAGCSDKAAGDGDKKVEYAKGTLTAADFQSEFLNLKFTAPADYKMGTEAEMQEMSDFGAEIAYSDVEKKIIDFAKARTVYEMMVSHTSGVPNVSLMVEKLTDKSITVEKYMEILKTQLKAVPDLAYTFDTPVAKATVAGQEYTVLTGILGVQGIEISQEYYLRLQDDRMVCFINTFTPETKDAKDQLLAAFQPLK